jgi:hypothetical protein
MDFDDSHDHVERKALLEMTAVVEIVVVVEVDEQYLQ